MFAIIDSLKNKLDQSRPLSDFTSRNIESDLFLRWIYHSNAISGNRLTLFETKVVLEGIAVGGKKLKDHFEVINHRNAIYYVENIIRKALYTTNFIGPLSYQAYSFLKLRALS